MPVQSPRPSPVTLACVDCHAPLPPATDDQVTCTGCGRHYDVQNGVSVLLPRELADDTEERQHALYNAVAHEYDDVFPRHVAEHYVDKRTGLVKRLLPFGGYVLDVGCGTGRLAEAIGGEGYDVYGADLSPEMIRKAHERGLHNTYAAVTTALPFADGSFDLALTVATLHHLETPERVAATIHEMARVVRQGGFVVLWDHNPSNPYWPYLMKRVPQDSGDERLVPLPEILQGLAAAKLKRYLVLRSGFLPDFMPRPLMPVWRMVERTVETVPCLNVLAAHNVVVGQKL